MGATYKISNGAKATIGFFDGGKLNATEWKLEPDIQPPELNVRGFEVERVAHGDECNCLGGPGSA